MDEVRENTENGGHVASGKIGACTVVEVDSRKRRAGASVAAKINPHERVRFHGG